MIIGYKYIKLNWKIYKCIFESEFSNEDVVIIIVWDFKFFLVLVWYSCC